MEKVKAVKESQKARYMKEHGCRLCLLYDACSHESCRYDGSRLYESENTAEAASEGELSSKNDSEKARI